MLSSQHETLSNAFNLVHNQTTMTRNLLAFFTLVVFMAFSGCEESDDFQLSQQKRIQQVLERFQKNEGISYQMFQILSERMTSDSLNALMALANSKEDFINVVARQTDNYFTEVVQGNLSAFDITTIPSPFSGEAEITLKLLASAENAGAVPFDAVSEYRMAVLEAIDVMKTNSHQELIFVQPSGALPSESVSLNFTKVEILATIPYNIILDLNLDDDQVADAIKEVFELQAIPPVVTALLLPAIQASRLKNTNDQPFNKAMNAWLEGPAAQAGSGLDRDIIRRIHATAYLAALHTILLDEYNGTNPDVALLSVLHASYRAVVIMTARELWME
jgi:hypothetical protein